MLNHVLETNPYNLFIIQVFIRYGSIYEKDHNTGTAHLLEHMMFKTKKTMTVDKLMINLNSLGGLFNAATSKDWTCYYIKTTKDNWEKTMKLMDTIVFDASFTNEDLRKEKKVVLEEFLQLEDDISSKIMEIAYDIFLKKDNIFRKSVKGDIKHIVDATATQLKDVHHKYYKDPNRCFFYINCPKSISFKVSQHAKGIFGKQYVNCDTIDDETWSGVLDTLSIKVVKHDSKQKIVCILFEGFAHNDESNIILDFVWEILTGNVNSLLMMEMREKRGLVYGIKSFTDPYRNGGVTGITFQSSFKDISKLILYVLQVLNKIKQKGLSENILKYAKASFINKLKYKLSDPEFVYERSVWRHYYASKLTEQNIFKKLLNISNLDIKQCCQKVFDFQKMAIVSMGDFKNTKAEEKKIEKLVKDYYD